MGVGAKGVGASAAYRQVASGGGGAARDCRTSKWGGAACAPKQEGGRSGGGGAAWGASTWVWQEPVNKRLSTRARPTGPSVERYLVLVWIIIGLQTAKAAMQGAGCRVDAGCRVQGAGCVRCGQGGHRQRPGDGCAISLQEISIVRQKRDSSVGRAVRGCGSGARCEGGAVGEASVKARYLHGVSARHRSWYEWIFLGLQGGGRAGAGGGRRWAGPTFRSARRRVLHVRARGKAPCQGRTLACSAVAVGAGWKEGPEERGRGCGAAPGERAEEG